MCLLRERLLTQLFSSATQLQHFRASLEHKQLNSRWGPWDAHFGFLLYIKQSTYTLLWVQQTEEEQLLGKMCSVQALEVFCSPVYICRDEFNTSPGAQAVWHNILQEIFFHELWCNWVSPGFWCTACKRGFVPQLEATILTQKHQQKLQGWRKKSELFLRGYSCFMLCWTSRLYFKTRYSSLFS